MKKDKNLIDIRTTGMTLGEVMDFVEWYAGRNPDYEIFMDGDAYAIVARKRVSTARSGTRRVGTACPSQTYTPTISETI